MKFQQLLLSCDNNKHIDGSLQEKSLGLGSPLPSRRGGLRSGSSTPYSGDGRTAVEISHRHEDATPSFEQNFHKRGRRGNVADEKEAVIELSVMLSEDISSSMGTDVGNNSSRARLRRHARRLSFDKELGPSKTMEGSNPGNKEVGISLRSKRKNMASPCREPESKASRSDQEIDEIVPSARFIRKGNAVAESCTPTTGEESSKKFLDNEVLEPRPEKLTAKSDQGQMTEEALKVDWAGSVEGQSGSLGKRCRGRPKKGTGTPVEEKNSIETEIKSSENTQKKRGRPKKIQVGESSSKPSGGSPFVRGEKSTEMTFPSLGPETAEKCVEPHVADLPTTHFSGNARDNMEKVTPEFISSTANMSPKRSVGRPKKLPVVSMKGRKSPYVGRDPPATEVRSRVDETEATTNATPDSEEKSEKRPRGRPRKPQNLFAEDWEGTASAIKSASSAVAESRPTKDVVTEGLQTTNGKMAGGSDIPEKYVQTPLTAPSSSGAERANTEEVLIVDPCLLFLKDAEESYPCENPSKEQPDAAIYDSEKGSACFTPNPVENTLKRSRGRPKKVQTAQGGLKTGPESADGNGKMVAAAQEHTLGTAHDIGSSDALSKMCIAYGSSPEIATRASVGSLEPVQISSPHQNLLESESDAKGEEHIEEAFVSSPGGITEGVTKRSVGRPRKTGGGKEVTKPHDGGLKQESANTGRGLVGRPRKVLAERNQDVPISACEVNMELLKKTSKDEEIAPRRRPNLRRKGVGHGKGTQDHSEKAGRKRGRPRKDKTERNGREGRRKAVGRRRPAEGQSTGAVRGKKVMAAQETSRRRYVNKVVLDGMEFRVGEDVYVRKDGAGFFESEAEVEQCQVCGKADERTMIECDTCLDGFHLTCLNPPLVEVPEDDWICPFCTSGSKPPVKLQNNQGRPRSAREMLLAAELWAARIEKIWSEQDGTYWFEARWFLIPEETSTGRQKHTGSRELFRSSQSDVNEMDSILRHCYVMNPDEYRRSAHEGDDVFYCEYEYNERWCRFKRIDYDNQLVANEGSEDEAYNPSDISGDELDGEEEKSPQVKAEKQFKQGKSPKAANKRQSFSGGIEQVGAKNVVDRPKKGPQSDFEKAKAALTLSAVPPSMPCRDVERTEIAEFLKYSVGAGEQCLGHCLYISGVPGTGKTATVREVIKDLESKVDAGELPAFRFVEINGLRLPSPDHVYTVLHEAFTGQHLGWKKALECLDDRFSSSKQLKGPDARPCVLLIDELDVLVNRNQSVLYNIFDWPSRPHSRLVVIGIANTMDLPERMLPRIVSRMGMKRISFSPYSHKQLEEIIASRLEGVRIFDKQAAEFASRKVAAVSGDVRRALELCRRAVEVAEARIAEHILPLSPENTEGLTDQVPEATPQLVTMADVDAAISQLFEAPQIQMMQRSSKLGKIFLTAMVCEQRRTSMVETTLEKVASTCSELCGNNGEDVPDLDTLLGVGCKLGTLRLLLCEPASRHKLQKLQLNFPCDDVSFALKTDSEVPWLVKYL